MERRGEVVYECRPGAASAPLSGEYRRHEPEKTVLYQIVEREFPGYARALRERGPGVGLPGFVERAVAAYMDCGRLDRGFARLQCATCHDEFLVAFSCKTRGLCPSCATRRMHDVAAHLVDRLFPHVPTRQWVLTFPRRVRWHLAADPKLAREAVALFVAARFTDYRRRARALGIVIPGPARARARACAAVSFLQRFSSDLTLNLHTHTVAVDGVFLQSDPWCEERPRFVPLPPPSDEDIVRLCTRVGRRVLALLHRRGRLEAEEAELPLDEGLVGPYALAARSPDGSGHGDPASPPRLCARRDGFSLHAGVAIHENDRQGLERLLCYAGRPPIALDRLSRDPDGQVRYRMKRTFSDGRREIVLAPHDFIARLMALLPPPRSHQLRYHGLFSGNAGGRAALVGKRGPTKGAARPPGTAEAPPPAVPPAPATDAVPAAAFPAAAAVLPQAFREAPSAPFAPTPAAFASLADPPPCPDRPPRLPWAELLRRIHDVDVLTCRSCGGRVRVIAFITQGEVVRRILTHLGLLPEPPRAAAPRAPPIASEYFADPPAADQSADPPGQPDLAP